MKPLTFCSAIVWVGSSAFAAAPGSFPSTVPVQARHERIVAFEGETRMGALSSHVFRTDGASVAVVRLGTGGDPFVTTIVHAPVTLVSVQFGRAGTVVYEVRPESNPPIALVTSTVSDCRAVVEAPLFEALRETLVALRAPRVRAPRLARAPEDTGPVLPALIATAAAASVVPECASTLGIFDCARTTPSLVACNSCCNDDIALESLALAAVCPTLGIYGPALCAGMLHLERRDCAQRCMEGFPNPLPRERERCGVFPEYGTCRLACPPGERQNYDYPCEGSFLACCVPTVAYP